MEFIISDLVFWFTQLLKFATFTLVLVLVNQVAGLFLMVHKHFVAISTARKATKELSKALSGALRGATAVQEKKNDLEKAIADHKERDTRKVPVKQSRAGGRGDGKKR